MNGPIGVLKGAKDLPSNWRWNFKEELLEDRLVVLKGERECGRGISIGIRGSNGIGEGIVVCVDGGPDPARVAALGHELRFGEPTVHPIDLGVDARRRR